MDTWKGNYGWIQDRHVPASYGYKDGKVTPPPKSLSPVDLRKTMHPSDKPGDRWQTSPSPNTHQNDSSVGHAVVPLQEMDLAQRIMSAFKDASVEHLEILQASASKKAQIAKRNYEFLSGVEHLIKAGIEHRALGAQNGSGNHQSRQLRDKQSLPQTAHNYAAQTKNSQLSYNVPSGHTSPPSPALMSTLHYSPQYLLSAQQVLPAQTMGSHYNNTGLVNQQYQYYNTTYSPSVQTPTPDQSQGTFPNGEPASLSNNQFSQMPYSYGYAQQQRSNMNKRNGHAQARPVDQQRYITSTPQQALYALRQGANGYQPLTSPVPNSGSSWKSYNSQGNLYGSTPVSNQTSQQTVQTHLSHVPNSGYLWNYSSAQGNLKQSLKVVDLATQQTIQPQSTPVSKSGYSWNRSYNPQGNLKESPQGVDMTRSMSSHGQVIGQQQSNDMQNRIPGQSELASPPSYQYATTRNRNGHSSTSNDIPRNTTTGYAQFATSSSSLVPTWDDSIPRIPHSQTSTPQSVQTYPQTSTTPNVQSRHMTSTPVTTQYVLSAEQPSENTLLKSLLVFDNQSNFISTDKSAKPSGSQTLSASGHVPSDRECSEAPVRVSSLKQEQTDYACMINTCESHNVGDSRGPGSVTNQTTDPSVVGSDSLRAVKQESNSPERKSHPCSYSEENGREGSSSTPPLMPDLDLDVTIPYGEENDKLDPSITPSADSQETCSSTGTTSSDLLGENCRNSNSPHSNSMPSAVQSSVLTDSKGQGVHERHSSTGSDVESSTNILNVNVQKEFSNQTDESSNPPGITDTDTDKTLCADSMDGLAHVSVNDVRHIPDENDITADAPEDVELCSSHSNSSSNKNEVETPCLLEASDKDCLQDEDKVSIPPDSSSNLILVSREVVDISDGEEENSDDRTEDVPIRKDVACGPSPTHDESPSMIVVKTEPASDDKEWKESSTILLHEEPTPLIISDISDDEMEEVDMCSVKQDHIDGYQHESHPFVTAEYDSEPEYIDIDAVDFTSQCALIQEELPQTSNDTMGNDAAYLDPPSDNVHSDNIHEDMKEDRQRDTDALVLKRKHNDDQEDSDLSPRKKMSIESTVSQDVNCTIPPTSQEYTDSSGSKEPPNREVNGHTQRPEEPDTSSLSCKMCSPTLVAWKDATGKLNLSKKDNFCGPKDTVYAVFWLQRLDDNLDVLVFRDKNNGVVPISRLLRYFKCPVEMLKSVCHQLAAPMQNMTDVEISIAKFHNAQCESNTTNLDDTVSSPNCTALSLKFLLLNYKFIEKGVKVLFERLVYGTSKEEIKAPDNYKGDVITQVGSEGKCGSLMTDSVPTPSQTTNPGNAQDIFHVPSETLSARSSICSQSAQSQSNTATTPASESVQPKKASHDPSVFSSTLSQQHGHHQDGDPTAVVGTTPGLNSTSVKELVAKNDMSHHKINNNITSDAPVCTTQDNASVSATNPTGQQALSDRSSAIDHAGQQVKSLPDRSSATNPTGQQVQALSDRSSATNPIGQQVQALSDRSSAIDLTRQQVQALPDRSSAIVLTGQQVQALPDRSSAIELTRQQAQALPDRSSATNPTGQQVQALPDRSSAIDLTRQQVQALPDRSSATNPIGQQVQALSDRSSAIDLTRQQEQALPDRSSAITSSQSQLHQTATVGINVMSRVSSQNNPVNTSCAAFIYVPNFTTVCSSISSVPKTNTMDDKVVQNTGMKRLEKKITENTKMKKVEDISIGNRKFIQILNVIFPCVERGSDQYITLQRFNKKFFPDCKPNHVMKTLKELGVECRPMTLQEQQHVKMMMKKDSSTGSWMVHARQTSRVLNKLTLLLKGTSENTEDQEQQK